MANSRSSIKRHKQNLRNRKFNRERKSILKTETRKFLDAIQAKDATRATEQFSQLTKKIDQIAAKGTLHRNTAARRKSRLAKRLNALQSSLEPQGAS